MFTIFSEIENWNKLPSENDVVGKGDVAKCVKKDGKGGGESVRKDRPSDEQETRYMSDTRSMLIKLSLVGYTGLTRFLS